MSLDISLIPQERIKDLISTLDTIQSNISTIDGNLTTTTSNLSTLQSTVNNNYTTLDNKIDSESSRIINIMDSDYVHKTGNEEINGIKTFNGSTPIILNNTTGKNCRLQLKDSTTTYGDSGVEIFQATSNNFNQFLIHFMNGNQYPFHIDQDASDSSKFTTYIDKKLVKGFVTEAYISGTNWYRIWSDNWIEQGGCWTGSTGTTVTLLKAFRDTNWTLAFANWGGTCYARKSGTNQIVMHDVANANSQGYSWYACGY